MSKPGEYGIESALSWLRWRPTYWRTLRNLRPDRSSLATDGHALRLEQYAFEPASVFPNRTIAPEQIAEVNLDLMQGERGAQEHRACAGTLALVLPRAELREHFGQGFGADVEILADAAP